MTVRTKRTEESHDVAVRVLDDLVLAEELLEQGDAITAGIRSAINEAAALDAAIAVATNVTAPVVLPIDFEHDITALVEADDEMRCVAELLHKEYGQNVPPETAVNNLIGPRDRLVARKELAQLCVLDVKAFEGAIIEEHRRHRRLKEPMALYEVRAERKLDAQEEVCLASALREFTINPDDRIGRLGDAHFGVLIPWIEPRYATGLLKTFTALAQQALPDAELSVGLVATTPNAQVQRPVLNPIAPEPALRRSRSR